MCRAEPRGAPKGKPEMSGVTLHSASSACGSRRTWGSACGSAQAWWFWEDQQMLSAGEGRCAKSPPHLPRRGGPSRGTSLTFFPGWDLSNAVHSRRAERWVYRSIRKKPSGIWTWVRLTRLLACGAVVSWLILSPGLHFVPTIHQ